MGFTLTLSMKHILLAALAGLLHAEVVVKHLHIHEGEVDYTQTVTFDYNRNIQILEVPAHNSIVHSKTIFDFNQGVLFESHPERNICYMKDIPEGVVSMDSFAAFLDKNNDTIIASQQKTTKRAYKTTKKIAPHQLSSMASEVVAECAGSTVFQVQPARPEEFALSYSRAPKSLADAFLAGKEECQMEDSCMWQTCQVGSSDSCWWTVNCRKMNITAMRLLSITVFCMTVLESPTKIAKCTVHLVSISSVQDARVLGIMDANLDLKLPTFMPVQLILHLGKIAVFRTVVSMMR